MKKTFLFILIIALFFSMVACKSTKVVEEEPVIEEVEAEPVAEEPVVENVIEIDIKGITGADIPGVLYQLQEGEPVIRGIALNGNRTENTGFTEPAAENIRFIFELNEWVWIYPDTDMVEGISARVAKHTGDTSIYTKAYIEECDFLAYADLYKPEEKDFEWGSFYLNGEEELGFYDLVFVNNDDNTPLAVIILDFFRFGELEKYSSDQLQQIMDDIIAEGAK